MEASEGVCTTGEDELLKLLAQAHQGVSFL